jgi:hypothetical protein
VAEFGPAAAGRPPAPRDPQVLLEPKQLRDPQTPAVAPSGLAPGHPWWPTELAPDQAISSAGVLPGRPAALRPAPAGIDPTASEPAGRAGGGRVVSLPEASPRTRGLARAAMCLDSYEVQRLLRDALATFGVVGTWETMISPVLQGLGERWEATGEGVEVEHAFSEAVKTALRGVSAAPYRPSNPRHVLLSCADGDSHSLPLHALAAALAEHDVCCRMLGVGLPSGALVSAVRRIGPAVIFIYAQLRVLEAGVLSDLPRQRPAPRVLVGGPGWHDAALPDGVGHVGSLRDAVTDVLRGVRL